MKAVYASTVNHADPLAALAVGEQPEPQARPFWSTVSVRAVTVNHHDVWSLQGVGLAAEQTPMILGTDAVGILDEDIPGKHGLKAGSEVVLYTFVGTDGAGGGVSTAAIQLAHAAGLEVFVTSRDADKRSKALKLGANAALETGARLPRKVDAVIESVGAATWGHSVRSVRPGGTIAICGATTGDQPGAELTRLFFQDIRVQGCTMGSREDFARLLRFVEHTDLHPVIDSVVSGLDAAPEAFARMIAGDMFGKIVIEL